MAATVKSAKEIAGAHPVLLRAYFTHEKMILGSLAVLLFLLFWEGLSRGWWADLLTPLIGTAAEALHIKALFVSAPTRIVRAAYRMTESGEIWTHIWTSGQAFLLGGFFAVVIAVPLGLAVGWYRWLNYALDPFLSGLNATPQVVFIPLVIIWVGTGPLAKAIIIFMLTVLPIAMSTLSGVRTIDARYLKVARSFGSSERFLFTSIILPSTVPFVLTGLRLGIGRAMVGIVVGEIYGSSAGIGHLINISGMSFETDKVFVGIVLLAIVGLVLTGIVHRVEKYVELWRPELKSGG